MSLWKLINGRWGSSAGETEWIGTNIQINIKEK